MQENVAGDPNQPGRVRRRTASLRARELDDHRRASLALKHNVKVGVRLPGVRGHTPVDRVDAALARVRRSAVRLQAGIASEASCSTVALRGLCR
jgi:hypothetical protein